MVAQSEVNAGPLVLVIDADENVARLLNIKLTRAGFRVIIATDSEQGLAQAVAMNPDLVVLEGTLTKHDGYQLTKELSRVREDGRPAIVFLSVHDGLGDIEEALRSGADDYITKPFSPNELVHRLRVTLIRRRLQTASPLLETSESESYDS